MNCLSEQNTLVWLVFTTYAATALFVLPNPISLKTQSSAEEHNERAFNFASQFLMRIVVIFPMIILFQNNI